MSDEYSTLSVTYKNGDIAVMDNSTFCIMSEPDWYTMMYGKWNMAKYKPRVKGQPRKGRKYYGCDQTI